MKKTIGILAHVDAGKTTFSEQVLYHTGSIKNRGRVDHKNSFLDSHEIEKKRGITVFSDQAVFKLNDSMYYLIDTPGHVDFSCEMERAISVMDYAIIIVSAVEGVQGHTETVWNLLRKYKVPTFFFINKLDREHSDFDKVLQNLKDQFGISVVPIQYPIGKEDNFNGVINVITKRARIYNPKTKMMEVAEIPPELVDKVDECKQMIMESVAETDEVLLEKYFSEGELSDLEIYEGLINGCASGDIAPVMCGSATKIIGINTLLEDIVECFPSPKYAIPQKALNIESNKEEFIQLSEDKPFSAMVFKTIADPFVGKISLFRVITGKLNGDMTVVNTNKNKTEKLAHVFFMRGKNQVPADEVIAGDIGAVAKLQYTSTGDTLCDQSCKIIYDKMNFPNTVMSMAVLPKSKGDEDKISLALSKLQDEDPVFNVSRDIENAETIISGLGEVHLEVIASKLKNKFGVEVQLRRPKIPYRETIKGSSDVQGKHKKQSGGHGQYGDVKILFEPRNDGEKDLEFVDKVVGGVVPRNFIPAVEKGLRDCIKHGILAGYPVIGLRATLHDGSYHPVDSSEMAFKIAASIAYKKGLEGAKPILLEPIMHIEILIPEEYMGDVIGDINKKRGRVLGMEPCGKLQKLVVEAPMAELFKFATDLRSITQGRGNFDLKIERYEEVPPTEAIKIVEKANEQKELKNEA